MSPTDQPDWALLSRYVSGDVSPAEAATVERWFAADSAHRALLDELRIVWDATASDTTGWDTDDAVAQLRERALGVRQQGRPVRPIVVVERRSRALLAAGFAIAVAGAAGLVSRFSGAPSEPTPVVVAAPTHVTTRRGQQAEVLLPDGTRVVLSAASSLRHYADYGLVERRVILDGEGYFIVAHEPGTPFRVESTHGVAEDLGTAFVVRARGNSALQVVVTDGAVVLKPRVDSTEPSDSLILTRGQLGRVLPDGGLSFRSRVDTMAYLAWTRGELVFTDTPLVDVAAELSRWYDAEVRVARAELARRPFTGRLQRRSIEEAVRLVAAVTNASVRQTDGGWTFR